MLNVVVLLLPAGMLPVSQAPLSLVEVCAILDVLLHVTVVPLVTVKFCGLKLVDPIVTVLDEFPPPPPPFPPPPPYGFVGLLFEQPAISRIKPISSDRLHSDSFVFISILS